MPGGAAADSFPGVPGEMSAQVGEIEIAYEGFGDRADPAMLLLMGLGTQMLGWHADFCRALAARRFHVVRFDNRDVGRSSQVVGGPRADVMAAIAGDTSSASYLLTDMAGDTVGLMDVLGMERAHLVGASQGGMIAQTVAIERPERVLSVVSLMSTTGNRAVGQAHPEAIPALLTRAPDDREGFADAIVRAFAVIGSPGYPGRDERVRERALASYDRGYYPEGVGRQLLAVLASGDRTEALGSVRVPTLVIHGVEDPLIDPSGGRATAAAIPGARLELIEGMGHDMPEPLWARLIDLIVENAARAAVTN
jgi:pimeloyl-ACP methyl ester carboxylesterase